MGSLSLLCDYSSSDEEVDTSSYLSRLPLPSLPSYGVPKSISREPAESACDGKAPALRNFPHEPGNWATFVAIPVHLPSEMLMLLEHLCDLMAPIQVKKVDDFHISLTKVLVLRYHWISGFIKSLSDITLGIPSFSISLQDFSVYLNDNQSRTFIAIKVNYGQEEINSIIDNLDTCLSEYNLPIYYSPRSLHMSVLWIEGNVKEKVEKVLNAMPLDAALPVHINSCYCKTGNKLFNLPFANQE